MYIIINVLFSYIFIISNYSLFNILYIISKNEMYELMKLILNLYIL